jgi:hypothetical protein
MTDIVERLRVHAWRSDGWNRQDAAEAADEIERLRAERDQLRAAILDTEPHDAGLVPMRLRLLALKENDQ